MDEEIAKWILEFLLRKQFDEEVVDGVLSTVHLTDNDNRLKKTLSLRRIDFEISNGSVSEKLLDLLEIIEELDHREGKTVSESMKQAYCAVAADCTVRFLEENVEKNNGKYVDAVERVCRERFCKAKRLVCDSEVCGKIMMSDTRNQALKAVMVYLTESWGSLGATILELLALKFGNDVEVLLGGSGGGGVGAPVNPCSESIVFEGIEDESMNKLGSSALTPRVDSTHAEHKPGSTEQQNTGLTKTMPMGLHAPPQTDQISLSSIMATNKVNQTVLPGAETHAPATREAEAEAEAEKKLDSDNPAEGNNEGQPPLPPPPPRNRIKKWTPLEEDRLRAAIQKYGRNWTKIRSKFFKQRTTLDLKDKWRNMIRK